MSATHQEAGIKAMPDFPSNFGLNHPGLSRGGIEPGRFRAGKSETNNATNVFEKTAALTGPVDLEDVKEYLRIDGDDEDVMLNSLVLAATEKAERFTRRAFITRTLTLGIDVTPHSLFIEIPRPPLISVVKIESFDEDDVATLFAATNYRVLTQRMVGQVVLKRGSSWPTDLRRGDGIIVEYTAGYGDTGVDTPDAIKTAIMRITGELYEHREDAVIGVPVAATPIPFTAATLLGKYKVPRL